MNVEQFDDLVELWDKEGQPPDIDWLEHAQDFRNQTQQLESDIEKYRLLVIDCPECYGTLKALLKEKEQSNVR